MQPFVVKVRRRTGAKGLDVSGVLARRRLGGLGSELASALKLC